MRIRSLIAALGTTAAVIALSPGVAHAALDSEGQVIVAEDGSAVITMIAEPGTEEGVAPPTGEGEPTLLNGDGTAVSDDGTVVDQNVVVLEAGASDEDLAAVSGPAEGEPMPVSAPADGEIVAVSAPVDNGNDNLAPFAALAGVTLAAGAGAIVVLRRRQTAGTFA